MFEYLTNIPKDKLLHSFYGCLIFAVCLFVSPAFALAATFGAAIGKEAYDQYKYRGWDWLDLAATVAIPTILFLMITYA